MQLKNNVEFFAALFLCFMFAFILSVVMLTSGCKVTSSTDSGKVVGAETQAPGTEQPPIMVDKPGTPVLAWGDKPEWTKQALESVRNSKLPTSSYSDMPEMCPKFKDMNLDQKVEVMAQFMSALAQAENSKFVVDKEYKEKFKSSSTGDYVISTGLYQISKSSTSASSYGCKWSSQSELHDPLKNIACAVKVMNYWTKSGNLMGTQLAQKTGCGAYWAVCRPDSSRYKNIKNYVKNLKICK